VVNEGEMPEIRQREKGDNILNGGDGCEDESVVVKGRCCNIQGIVKGIQNEAWIMGNHGELTEILQLHCCGYEEGTWMTTTKMEQ